MNELSFPTNLIDFDRRFPNEESCREYFEQLRWPNGFNCPRCCRPGWRLKGRALFECQKGHQTSLTARTVFHGTRHSLRLWFRVIFLMTAQKQGISAKNLMRLLGLRSYQTAWHWLHKLRKAMVRRGRDRLLGPVEEDECFLPGASTGEGRACGLPQVLGAVESDGKRLGRVRLQMIKQRDRETIAKFTWENVRPGSAVATDGYQGYMELANRGYEHRPHTKDWNALPGIHRVFGLLQRWILGTHQGAVSRKHLPAYLEEYTFRFNRRRSSSPGRLFARLIEQAAYTRGETWRQLVHDADPRSQSASGGT